MDTIKQATRPDLIYSPLNVGRHAIRLLKLLPSTIPDARVVCTLHVVSLDDDPTYEAVSYCWGDPTVVTPITLESTDWQITKNLAAALRFFRQHDKPRVLWVDAVCIDQQDTQERNLHVSLMARVYDQADHVRIWLGEESPSTKDACDFLRTLDQYVVRGTVRLNLPESRVRAIIDALLGLFSRPWWRRAWVLQEFILARRATLHCGKESIGKDELPSSNLWQSLALAVHFRRYTDSEDDRVALQSMPSFLHAAMAWKRDQPTRGGFEPFVLLNLFGRDVTDPLDRVYSLLGMCDPQIRAAMRPDYCLSVAQVYADFTYHLIKADRSLDFICFACPGKSLQSAPSWALDLSSKVSKQPVCYVHRTCSQIPLEVHLSSDASILHLKGCLWDQVARRRRIHEPRSVKRSVSRQSNRQWRAFFGLGFAKDNSRRYVTGELLEEVYWRTTINDSIINVDSGERRRSTGDDIDGYTAWLRDNNDDIDNDNAAADDEIPFTTRHDSPENQIVCEFSNAVLASQSEGVLVATSKGYFGLVSGAMDVRVGDKIFLLAGANCPFLLRPVDPAEKASPTTTPMTKYRLVSELYVHGIMDGEANDSGPWDEIMLE